MFQISTDHRTFPCTGLGIPNVPPPEVEPNRWSEAVPVAVEKGKADVDLAAAFNSDLFWCSPEHVPTAWRHPEGKPIFDCYAGQERKTLGQPGVFAHCEDLKEVEAFDWPCNWSTSMRIRRWGCCIPGTSFSMKIPMRASLSGRQAGFPIGRKRNVCWFATPSVR